jgi:hypothetical protein
MNDLSYASPHSRNRCMRSLNINLICINVYIPSHPPLYKKVTYFINLFLNVHEPRVVVGIQRDT